MHPIDSQIKESISITYERAFPISENRLYSDMYPICTHSASGCGIAKASQHFSGRYIFKIGLLFHQIGFSEIQFVQTSRFLGRGLPHANQ